MVRCVIQKQSGSGRFDNAAIVLSSNGTKERTSLVPSTKSPHALRSCLSSILIPSALQEVVPIRTGVGDHTLVSAPAVGEDYSIRPGTTASIRVIAAKDREFLVRCRVRKGKTFIVVVGMRVAS